MIVHISRAFSLVLVILLPLVVANYARAQLGFAYADIKTSLEKPELIALGLARPLWLTRNEVEQDLIAIQELLKKHQPNYGLIQGVHALDASFNRTRQALRTAEQQSYGLNEAYNIFTKAVNKLRDGHTCLRRSYADSMSFFAQMKIIENEIILIDNDFHLQQEESSDLKKIISINGKSIKQITAELKDLICAEQFTDPLLFLPSSLELRYYLALMFLENSKDYDTMVLQDRSGERSIARINKRNFGLSVVESMFELALAESYALEWQQGLPVLRISSFMDNKQEFPRFLKQAFAQIETSGAKDLIIDLRDNSGGYVRNASLLLAYLLDKQHFMPKYISTTGKTVNDDYEITRDAAAFQDAYSLQQGVKWYKNELNKEIKRMKSWPTQYAVKPQGFAVPVKPLSWGIKEFSGKVHVLISPRTFSAASQMIRQLRENNSKARFYGQPAGGGGARSCIMPTFSFVLPHSGFLLDVPFVCEMQDLKADGQIFKPDVEIKSDQGSAQLMLDQVIARIKYQNFIPIPLQKPSP